jgi:hypothetical protein
MLNFLISELVNKNGTRLGSDNINLSVDDSISTSNSTLDPMFNPDTGEQIKSSSVQSTTQQGYKGWYSLLPMPSVKASSSINIDVYDNNIDHMKDVKKTSKQKSKKITKKKIDEMIEDLVRKKNSKDIINYMSDDNELKKDNDILEIDNISEENPLLVRKVKALIDIIEKNEANGEQKGIILNFLIKNIGTVDIPSNYKKEIMNNI